MTQNLISHKIWWSNVVVKKRPKNNNVFVNGKWEALLAVGTTLSGVVMVHVLALFAPFVFSWSSFWMAVFLCWITTWLGICLSYHRNLTHKSFTLPKWLEYFFAYCGVLALQGDPIEWVSTHRYHHQVCDSDQDPHTPTKGFWYSHMNWLFDTSVHIKGVEQKNVEDLKKQFFYRVMKSTYILHTLALGGLLYAIGGFSYLVWGIGVRTTCAYHMTWFVNSACHIWGTQTFHTGDLSRNNWWVALISWGEGWHNNHHAFAYSARHGLEWWELDMTWYAIKFLEIIGLAKDVRLPTQLHQQQKKK